MLIIVLDYAFVPLLDLPGEHLVHDVLGDVDLVVQLDQAVVPDAPGRRVPLDHRHVVHRLPPNQVCRRPPHALRDLIRHRCLIVVELAIVVEVDLFVVVVTARQMHYSLVLRPAGAYCFVYYMIRLLIIFLRLQTTIYFEWSELALLYHGVPLRNVIVVVKHRHKVSDVPAAIKLKVDPEKSGRVVLTAALTRRHQAPWSVELSVPERRCLLALGLDHSVHYFYNPLLTHLNSVPQLNLILQCHKFRDLLSC